MNVSTVAFDSSVSHAETKACASAAFLCRERRIKYFVQNLGFDTRPCVTQTESNPAVFRSCLELNQAFSFHGGASIDREIDQHLGQVGFVALDRWQRFLQVELDANRALKCFLE